MREADKQLAKCPRLQGEQTIAAEIIDEDFDSTKDDVAEILEAVLLVSETKRKINGEIEDLNTKAKAKDLIAKKVDAIATAKVNHIENAIDTTGRARADIMSKKVGNALSAFGTAESTLEKDRPALDNVNRRFEAVAKAKNFGQSSTTGKFDSLQKFLRPSLKVSDNLQTRSLNMQNQRESTV
ncbi:hypothetical protein COL940_001112 [Colletotrichum noveboracense]|nr:hypothetical protein COL940_001112 [Colletotrichum noveboracense]KAJ0293033.1 hypothetical protein CBS470a_002236 [Colletotrichum nupharicola]